MPLLAGCVALLGTWAADDANEAVRALAERTQQLPAFSATYQVTGRSFLVFLLRATGAGR